MYRQHRHVQLYDVARTAHFERNRATGLACTILYRERRYDFDPELAREVGARRVGTVGAFRYMLAHDVDTLEIAEPLLERASLRSLAAILALRIRGAFTRRRGVVVTYAIENKDPRAWRGTLPAHSRMRMCLYSALSSVVWRSIDRIAYGTSQAADLYALRYRTPRAADILIPALPVASPAACSEDVRAPRIVFLGEFSDRKGFPLVLEAWFAVQATRPDVRLVLIGKGPGESEARAIAASDDAVEAFIDPPRDRIFELLRTAKVLVLPSQPRPRWREQVGLPIIEGLASGCEIVTTSETGLAEWLLAHGHRVLSDPTDVPALHDALVSALESSRSPADIMSDLPTEDGRASADRWLRSQHGDRAT